MTVQLFNNHHCFHAIRLLYIKTFFSLRQKQLKKSQSLRTWRLLLLKCLKNSSKSTKTFCSKTYEMIRPFENLSAATEAVKTYCNSDFMRIFQSVMKINSSNSDISLSFRRKRSIIYMPKLASKQKFNVLYEREHAKYNSIKSSYILR